MTINPRWEGLKIKHQHDWQESWVLYVGISLKDAQGQGLPTELQSKGEGEMGLHRQQRQAGQQEPESDAQDLQLEARFWP